MWERDKTTRQSGLTWSATATAEHEDARRDAHGVLEGEPRPRLRRPYGRSGLLSRAGPSHCRCVTVAHTCRRTYLPARPTASGSMFNPQGDTTTAVVQTANSFVRLVEYSRITKGKRCCKRRPPNHAPHDPRLFALAARNMLSLNQQASMVLSVDLITQQAAANAANFFLSVDADLGTGHISGKTKRAQARSHQCVCQVAWVVAAGVVAADLTVARCPVVSGVWQSSCACPRCTRS